MTSSVFAYSFTPAAIHSKRSYLFTLFYESQIMSHTLSVIFFSIMDALGIKIEPTAGDATNSGVEQVILSFKSLNER